jgi:hypothetical protein
VSGLDKKEWINTKRRIRENAHVVEIVYQSLSDRVASYRFALERMVIATPETQAVEVERVLNQLPPTWVLEPSLAANR